MDLKSTCLKGWFQIGWSDSFNEGDVVPLRYFGRDLVFWRSAEGEPRVFDAYCPHKGAHLGYGGRVLEDCIRCPFHGIEWAGEGKATNAPWLKAGIEATAYPVVDRGGAVLMWHGPPGEEPFPTPPPISEAFESSFHWSVPWPAGASLLSGEPVIPQYVVEDRVDLGHFVGAHQNSDSIKTSMPVERYESEQMRIDVVMSIPVDLSAPDGRSTGLGVNSIYFGMGLGYFQVWGTVDALVTFGVTPVDDHHSDMFHTVQVSKEFAGRISNEAEDEARIAAIKAEYLRDVEIWRHLRYTTDVVAVGPDEDRLMRLRAWSEGFYSYLEVDS